jgi:hypothetical protein
MIPEEKPGKFPLLKVRSKKENASYIIILPSASPVQNYYGYCKRESFHCFRGLTTQWI